MKFKIYGFLIIAVAVAFNLFASDELENMFLRKAVKEYVAKDYISAVSDLQQVLVANPQNTKAKKLIIKTYMNLGDQAFMSKNGTKAVYYYSELLKYDPSNLTAKDNLEKARRMELDKERIEKSKEFASKSVANGVKQPMTQLQPQVIVTQPENSTKDSVQAKVIADMFKTFSSQQELFSKQIEASQKAMEKNDDDKNKYLDVLIETTAKNDKLLKRYLVIGGAIVLGIILLILIVFVVIFFVMARSSNLRTVQTNEAMQLLLTNATMQQDGSPKLMLSGPSATGHVAEIKDGDNDGNNIESLNNENPIERANAVEAVAAEIVDGEESSKAEKIAKLKELLSDQNNRVRANAAKALYPFDKESSLKTLLEMVKNDSKRMRASAVWALGEIATQDALKLILTLKDEVDEIVMFNIKVALGKIMASESLEIDEETKNTIDTMLEKYKDLV